MRLYHACDTMAGTVERARRGGRGDHQAVGAMPLVVTQESRVHSDNLMHSSPSSRVLAGL